MGSKKNPAQNPALNKVKEKFETWRRTRKGNASIPEELWQAAINVFHSEGYTLHQIARELRLNQTEMKRHMENVVPIIQKSSHPEFIEMNCATQPDFISECIVEMEDSSGSKMKMCFKGKTDFDLIELGKSFWNKQQ